MTRRYDQFRLPILAATASLWLCCCMLRLQRRLPRLKPCKLLDVELYYSSLGACTPFWCQCDRLVCLGRVTMQDMPSKRPSSVAAHAGLLT